MYVYDISVRFEVIINMIKKTLMHIWAAQASNACQAICFWKFVNVFTSALLADQIKASFTSLLCHHQLTSAWKTWWTCWHLLQGEAWQLEWWMGWERDFEVQNNRRICRWDTNLPEVYALAPGMVSKVPLTKKSLRAWTKNAFSSCPAGLLGCETATFCITLMSSVLIYILLYRQLLLGHWLFLQCKSLCSTQGGQAALLVESDQHFFFQNGCQKVLIAAVKQIMNLRAWRRCRWWSTSLRPASCTCTFSDKLWWSTKI